MHSENDVASRTMTLCACGTGSCRLEIQFDYLSVNKVIKFLNYRNGSLVPPTEILGFMPREKRKENRENACYVMHG